MLNKQKNTIKTKWGFTLAEVLITLGIIGIVAAVTIPTMMNKTNEKELRTAWKKQFSVFSSAFNSIAQDNGGDFIGLCTDSNHTCLKNLFKDKLSVVKDCDVINATDGICWHKDNNWYFKPKSARGRYGSVDTAGFILKDGTLVNFIFYKSDCTNYDANSTNAICANFSVDVNGFKPPNTIGVDIFSAHVQKNRIIPVGAVGDSDSGSACSVNGWYCSADYLYQ